jgi:hypothetical protein
MNIHPSRQAYVEEEDGAVSLTLLLQSLFICSRVAYTLHVPSSNGWLHDSR